MKKIFSLLIILTISQYFFGQESLLDSIKTVKEQNQPNNGKSICTNGFWSAQFDGGVRMFKQICRMDTKMEFKLSDKKTVNERSVLVLDFMNNGIKRDEVYLFAIKKENQWLIDGFNETKNMIDYFLAEKCSGHFHPTSIKKSSKLEIIAKEIAQHLSDITSLNSYLKEISEDGLNYFSISTQLTDTGYKQPNLSYSGFSEELDKGYIYFKQENINEEYDQDITIYFKQNENGKYIIYNYGFLPPSSYSFFN